MTVVRQFSHNVIRIATRVVRGFLPARLPQPWRDDAASTFHDVCHHAYDSRGIAGLAMTMGSEATDLARTAVRARAGRRLPITGGHAPHQPAQKGRSPMQTLLPLMRWSSRA